ncbi:endoplasmic reticulum-Golgi intermediate compartment protein 1-like isoform X1 [Ornithodoros turicata]|uniref:endoplasmic reticulum-Golgi intermediate compartment protein 1-like isoform X1 n=1 Tax=Ornithodoros turicata TaxID=34597 RepID=UPI00313A41BF
MVFDVRSKVTQFDIYRKIPKDLTQPTLTGAAISIISCAFIFILFLSELISYLRPELVSELFVDNPTGAERVPVELNITLLRLDCSVVGLDIQDDMGRHEVGFVENTEKTPVGEGCRFEGKFFVHKVPGNFHVSTHAAKKQPDKIDMTHIIHGLTFGERMTEGVQGGFNSLKGMDKSAVNGLESHDYVMKIVPTIYETPSKRLESYQYTYAYKSYVSISHTGRITPAIWFRYDLNPITVKYSPRGIPFYSFLTSVCAIVGGTFTVAGIVDSLVFTASEVFRKHEMGKLS